ncbi:MAG: hypothetical protein ACRC1T_04885 [Clostridium chrysemydis]|uniref:hypothetical protein n=1 Tax=Clostridium chrysemydis TaxID=2665504 RepID=UPI003F3BA7F7
MEIAYINWEYVPILLIIIIGIACFIKWLMKGDKDTDKLLLEVKNNTKKNYREKENIEYLKPLYGIKYLGGFKDLGKKDNNITLLLFKDRIRFEFDKDNYRDIMNKNVTDCKIISDKEVRQQISVGKIVLLGVFALAGNNTKEVDKEYLLLECYYEGDKISIVLDCGQQYALEECVKDIRKLMKNNDIKEEDFKEFFELKAIK